MTLNDSAVKYMSILLIYIKTIQNFFLNAIQCLSFFRNNRQNLGKIGVDLLTKFKDQNLNIFPLYINTMYISLANFR